MVIRSTLDFAVRQSWLLLPSAAAGAGAGFAIDGLSPVMAGGAALGMAPALAAGLALDLRGYRLRTADDVERRFELEALGSIGRFKQSPGSALPTDDYPDALQAYKELAASLHARGGHEPRTLLVTSAGPEEGKSTTAANLATVLAELGNKVVLVDGDLRWSSLRSTLANASSLGLAGLLLNYLHTPQLAVVRTNEHNLYLLPAGVLPPNPQELLALPRLGDIIASLRKIADYVIFDSPPVLEAEDARLIARNADATLMVMHAGKTRSREVKRALRVLAEAGVRPLGAVLNAVRTRTPEPVTIPSPSPVAEPEPANFGFQPSSAPAPQPFTVDAFRKGPPRPTSANVPRPYVPEPEPAVLRLAQESFENDGPSPAFTSNGFNHPDEVRPLTALRNLRVVQEDERPLAPLVNDWEPVVPPKASPAPESLKPAIAAVPPPPLVTVQAPAPQPAQEPEVSVDDVLAHMHETLRLIREMRQEKSVTST